ncbi:MAG TPA: YggS family pyridoxal phosphate-dependent enzyme [Candidatus Polarisedimenticolia bacterium]|nr:YggS family pyridoxal phosphate-dependent enzyme [Candidatus Polarisedimenticolia bacterium]
MSAGHRVLEQVAARIEAAARRAGRDPGSITLVGVTKTVPAAAILEAVLAGLRHIGENRVQEAASKAPALAGQSGVVTWHLIGHLQSNKAARAAELFQWIHSVDNLDLGRRLDQAAGRLGRRLDVLMQVDLGHEPTKHGVDAGRLEELSSGLASLERLRLRGLMTIPPLFDDPGRSRPFFRQLRVLRDRLAARGQDLPELSMGMSGDFEVAIEEGATMVRVGRALFGERPPGARPGA